MVVQATVNRCMEVRSLPWVPMKKRLCPGRAIGITDSAPEDSPSHPSVGWWDASEGVRPTGIKRYRVKCPECGRKLMTSVSLCDDGCCIYHRIPPHKPKGWWKKGKKAKSGKKKNKRLMRRMF